MAIPEGTAKLVDEVNISERHPGLQLDKFGKVYDSEKYGKDKGKDQEKPLQFECLDAVCQTEGDNKLLQELGARRAKMLAALHATIWRCVTTGPLTLHLSRASALENAGICLHPLYGFVYLPGSGLKGMARAWAETVWLPTQFEADGAGAPRNEEERRKACEAWKKIEAVFGWAPGSDKTWKPQEVPEHPEEEKASTGAVVFHDAWPQEWPKLHLDIVNCHHPRYYRGEDAPGDWEDPNMVNFLAIGPGETFSFALSKRTASGDDGHLELAKKWLMGALCHLGAGAKTAAGYGAFRPVGDKTPELPEKVRKSFPATLELVTPAFLAGARQEEDDCDLRPATLRGLLRWWWRTMHAGFVSVKELRAMEAAVWGDTNAGGAVTVRVERSGPWNPERYDKHAKANMSPQEKRSACGIPDCNPRKTTQGLWYQSYGMDESKRRLFAPAGTGWNVTLTARESSYRTPKGSQEAKTTGAEPDKVKHLGADLVLEQAQAALWLLCRFGGVGSKARKGFGSFADPKELAHLTLEDCQDAARRFRETCGVKLKEQEAESSSLGNMLDTWEIETTWQDCWHALDQLGFAVQAFAQGYAHKAEKGNLGLPRKIHGPKADGPIRLRDGTLLQDPETWKRPVWLGRDHPKRCPEKHPKDMRHASPVHVHLTKEADGTLTIRVAAFPAKHLPDLYSSREFLGKLLEHLKKDLERRVKECPDKGRHPAPRTAEALHAATGEVVDAVLLEEKTKKGSWRARHEPSGLSGPIQNWQEVPPDKMAGATVRLTVVASNPRTIDFRWPTAADEERGQKKPPPGRPRGDPHRRRDG